MIKHQNSRLPVQVSSQLMVERNQTNTVSVRSNSTASTLQTNDISPLSLRPNYRAPSSSRPMQPRSSSSPVNSNQIQHHKTKSMPVKRANQYRSQFYRRQPRTQNKLIQTSEYKNLRQVLPSLRRQKDVGKVEVVTEAARYIDHLHKTLIERFVLCGIPDSLKDILGTNDANELNSQHIMNLVTNMAAKQQEQQQPVSINPAPAQVNYRRQRQLNSSRQRPISGTNYCAPQPDRSNTALTKNLSAKATGQQERKF